LLELKSNGLRAVFSENGARLMALEVDGVDVVFGNALDFDIATGDASAGSVCGRFAGRISKAEFELDGEVHKLVPNRDGFQLHGGPNNFGNQNWQPHRKGNEITFSFVSPDGDQGFPGLMRATATYRLLGKVLSLELIATTTKPTVINLTNHAYWNLMGPAATKNSAFGQEVQINAAHYLPLTSQLLPTGEIAKVESTRFDFRKLRKVGEAYDNCYMLGGTRGGLKQALTMRDPTSGRRMEVWTTEPAVQFYTAIHWNDTVRGKISNLLNHQAIAIEPQNAPDAPNHANFPSSVLRPGQTYHNRIEWRFG
jgi:aldose 1-epimerase